MIAPPGGGSGGGSGGGKGGSKEDMLRVTQMCQQILNEQRLNRDLLLDMMKQMNLQINPDTLRSNMMAADQIVSPSGTGNAGGMMPAGVA